MIEYAKSILPVVWRWEFLFKKELLKSLEWMTEDEYTEFYQWCYSRFSPLYSEFMDEIFADLHVEQSA